jgi:hypothetical protein
MNKHARHIAIVFGMLSCRTSAAAISQFADAVAPHRILVHHDFSQAPEWRIDKENVVVLPDHENTAWGSWSLVSVALKLLERALATEEFDYFQLVSESCLPVRPIAQFEEYLGSVTPDVMIDMQPIKGGTPAAILTYAWRYFPRSPLLARIARKGSAWCIGNHYTCRPAYGVNLKVPKDGVQTWNAAIMRVVGRKILTAFLSPRFGAFPLGEFEDCWVGSQWFGLSRAAAERLLALRSACPELEVHFKRCHIPDESYVQTLVAKCAFANVHPGNHVTFWDEERFGPDQISVSDLLRIKRSGRFFARKFTLDAMSESRQAKLALQRQTEPDAGPVVSTPSAPDLRDES